MTEAEIERAERARVCPDPPDPPVNTAAERREWDAGASAVKQYHRLIHKVARHFVESGACPPDLDYDDVVQELSLHLGRKFHKFDPARRVKPLTYACVVLHRHVANVLARHCRRGFTNLPDGVGDDGRRGKLFNVQPASYDETMDGAVRPSAARYRCRPTFRNSTRWTAAQWDDLLRRIPGATTRRVIKERFRRGLSLSEVGEAFGKSKEWARLMVKKGLAAIQEVRDTLTPDRIPGVDNYPEWELERSSLRARRPNYRRLARQLTLEDIGHG